MIITNYGRTEKWDKAYKPKMNRYIIRGLILGKITGTPIDSSKKKKALHTGVCDMCGITILQGKHCKACSDKKRNTYISYSKSIFE